MEHIPSSAIAADNRLYLRPVPHSNGDLWKPWFFTQPVGKHTLTAMVKEACAEIGITEKTNHSLQATGATTTFNSGVPEKVIQERTGHLSLVGLRTRERPSVEQHIAASQVIAAKHDTPFQVALKLDTPFQTSRSSEQ